MGGALSCSQAGLGGAADLCPANRNQNVCPVSFTSEHPVGRECWVGCGGQEPAVGGVLPDLVTSCCKKALVEEGCVGVESCGHCLCELPWAPSQLARPAPQLGSTWTLVPSNQSDFPASFLWRRMGLREHSQQGAGELL